jgi:hypothetical protein
MHLPMAEGATNIASGTTTKYRTPSKETAHAEQLFAKAMWDRVTTAWQRSPADHHVGYRKWDEIRVTARAQ